MHPGVGIIKVRQGLVEIILRLLITILCIPLLIISSIALDHVQDKFVSSIPTDWNNIVKKQTNVDYNQMIKDSTTGSGIVIGVSSFIILYEMVVIVARFVNINVVNKRIKIFLSLDIIVSFVIAAMLALVGILTAYAASQWSDANNNDLVSLIKSLFGIVLTDVVKARDLLSAIAGLSFGGTLLYAFHLFWMVLFLVKNWNPIVSGAGKGYNIVN